MLLSPSTSTCCREVARFGSTRSKIDGQQTADAITRHGKRFGVVPPHKIKNICCRWHKSTQAAFISEKYPHRYWYWYRYQRNWPCNYLVSDRYKNSIAHPYYQVTLLYSCHNLFTFLPFFSHNIVCVVHWTILSDSFCANNLHEKCFPFSVFRFGIIVSRYHKSGILLFRLR